MINLVSKIIVRYLSRKIKKTTIWTKKVYKNAHNQKKYCHAKFFVKTNNNEVKILKKLNSLAHFQIVDFTSEMSAFL